MKKIGILTSGGDAPGMNAAIRAVVRTAISMGVKPYGIMRGYNGMIEGEIIELNARSVSNIINKGGTILKTARSPRFKTEEGMKEAIDNCHKIGIEGVVVIGGDGSYRGARDLSERGLPCIGLPGTIDNDISSTEYTIGYDTAMNTAMDMIDKLRDTMESHERCIVAEIMGRGAGWLALETGIAAGATAILVPEVPYDFEADVIQKIKTARANGKSSFIICVSEAIGHIDEMAKRIQTETGVETRDMALAHVQRGGRPTVKDCELAARMGYKAVELLSKGIGNRVVGIEKGEIVDFDIFEALQMKKDFDVETYKIANVISI